MKRKGFTGLEIIGLVAVISFIGALVFVPDIATSIQSMIGADLPCSVAKYDPNCFCPEDMNKLPIALGAGGGWYCESPNLMFDPSDSNFESLVTDYAKNKLSELYPECDTVDCPTDAAITVDLAQEVSGNRKFIVACKGSTDYWWEIYVDVEDGSTERAVCRNYEQQIIGEMTPAEFKAICDASIHNQYCSTIFESTESVCSTHEIFPASACASGRQCTKGVGYNYESQKNNPEWTGCGYLASKSW